MTNQVFYGIDISHNSGPVDFSKVISASPPISFVIINATKGETDVDPMLETYAKAAADASIRIGYRHTAVLNSNVNPAKDCHNQSQWFLKFLRQLPPASLFPVLDIQTNEVNLSPALVQDWILSFFVQVNFSYGITMYINSNSPFLNANLPPNHTLGNLPLWLSQETNDPAPTLPVGWTDYTIWQYNKNGNVNGVSANCGMNKGYSPILF